MRVLSSDNVRDESDPAGAYERLVVYTDFFGPAYQYSNGLSIYFPWRAPEQKILDRYENYAFHQKAGVKWLDFLSKYFEETRRSARSKQLMPGSSNGHVSWQKMRTPEEWAQLSTGELLSLSQPSDKSGGALANPDGSDKSGGALGLFGLTVIKNFENPIDAVVTSRPKGHPWDGPRTGRTQAQ
jgi:hypothetical protein